MRSVLVPVQVSLSSGGGTQSARFFVLCPAEDSLASTAFAEAAADHFRACGLGQLLPFPATEIHPNGAVVTVAQAGTSSQACPTGGVRAAASMATRKVAAALAGAEPLSTDDRDMAARQSVGTLAAEKLSDEEMEADDVPFAIPCGKVMPQYQSSAATAASSTPQDSMCPETTARPCPQPPGTEDLRQHGKGTGASVDR